MKFGDKPLSEMSLEEMRAAVDELRNAREALRADAITRAKEKSTKTVLVGAPGERPRKVKAPSDKDKLNADMLAFLKGDD